MIEDDYRMLKRHALALPKARQRSLARGLERADIVRKASFPANVIRLYTKVSLVEKKTKKRISFTIVLPQEADKNQKKLSALTSIAVALIGFRQGEEVKCKLPGGYRRFLIDEVENNPAA